MVLVLTNEDVEQMLSMDQVITSLKSMYEGLGDGTAKTRPRTDVHALARTDEDEYYRFKTMGGYVPSAGVYALRINSDVLRWVEQDGDIRQEKLPRAEGDRYVGLILLFDADDGTPLAVLPDGYLQKLRVGATSAIGAEWLARSDADTFGLLGSGWQAEGQLSAMTTVFDLSDVYVYSPTPTSRDAFVDTFADDYDCEIRTVDDPKDAFGADIVHSATNSRSPVYDVDWLTPGQHLGSINKLEIDPRALDVCEPVVVHTATGKAANYTTSEVEPADIPYLRTESQPLTAYPELSDVLAGNGPERTADDISFFFNNQGIGSQFAAVGALAYQSAIDEDRGTTIPTDLFTQSMVP